MSQQFCLKWNNHMNNMMDVFKSLLSTESMVDVTLACDGLSLKAHKMVLSACSPFFQSLFLENPCKHPIVILKDMKYTELKAIIEFMYHGEVNVAQDQLSALMKTAETLRVKGLAEVTNEKNSQSNNSSQDEPGHRSVPRTDTPPPPNKRRRGRTRKRSLSDSNRSDDDSNEPKIKQPMSPEIEELSGGDGTMDASNSQFSSMQSQVPMQSTPSHSSNTFHKSSSVISQPQIEEPASADESEFGVEPAKLLEQTLTTDELNARRRSSNIEMQRRSRSSADHSTIVPTSMSSDTSNQQPDSPPDIKPELLELDPPMSPVAGPSHSNDNAMMMYMDQSSTSHPGPSGYQDNTALVPQDSQNQGLNKKINTIVKNLQTMWRVMRALLETSKRIENKVDAFIKKYNIHTTKFDQEDNGDGDLDLMTSLPLKLDDFPNFDRKLAKDSNIRKRVIKVCMTVVGREPKTFVCNILRTIIQDEVAEKYSLTGKSTKIGTEKQCFEKTETYKLIMEIYFLKYKDIKGNVAREAMSDWLMQAKFRKGRREKRLELSSKTETVNGEPEL